MVIPLATKTQLTAYHQCHPELQSSIITAVELQTRNISRKKIRALRVGPVSSTSNYILVRSNFRMNLVIHPDIRKGISYYFQVGGRTREKLTMIY